MFIQIWEWQRLLDCSQLYTKNITKNSKYIVSIYYLLISWSVTLTIHAHTLHTFTPIFQRKLPYTRLFLHLTTIIQFTFIQHNILSLFFHQTLIQIDILIYKTLFPLLQLLFNLHSFNITYSLSSFTKLSFKSIYLFTRLFPFLQQKHFKQYT